MPSRAGWALCLALFVTSEVVIRGAGLLSVGRARVVCPETCLLLLWHWRHSDRGLVNPTPCNFLADCSGGLATCNQSCASALLQWSSSISNWPQIALANNFSGWYNQSSENACSWTGIACQQGLVNISLGNIGLVGAASFRLL